MRTVTKLRATILRVRNNRKDRKRKIRRSCRPPNWKFPRI